MAQTLTRDLPVSGGRGTPSEDFLRSTDVVNWTDPSIRDLAARLATGLTRTEDIARACFEWVRDQVAHSVDAQHEVMTCVASDVLRERTGFCYAKSHLLVALLRASGIPAGFCYQRLARDPSRGSSFVLHGFAAAYLPERGWYRFDPRGNKPGVNAQFIPPVEQLAFPIEHPGEQTFDAIFPDPAPSVVHILTTSPTVSDARLNLPDAALAADLR